MFSVRINSITRDYTTYGNTLKVVCNVKEIKNSPFVPLPKDATKGKYQGMVKK
jgi:hypothetical protein